MWLRARRGKLRKTEQKKTVFGVSLFILLMRFVFPTISVDANRITMAEGVVGLDGHIG